ncbi:zinc-ribbon domain-containing protein [uncultured Shimia sp.]|uniref:zinc-ribbon domain-containing protein n=1 Tax=uncultured Shimia sp. TaxID=573152 RepID=UPI00261A0119|nr:zinc-ribbon domain-containing protein [uncultured Shimia sp.]
MRLTCPNCGAQYEVPDDIIPTGGRDVQCSNCGNTWFQVHADMQAEVPVEEAVADVVAETPEETEQAPAAPEATDFEEVEPPELSIEAAPDEEQDFFTPQEEEENADDLDLGGDDWDLETDDSWAESDTDEATETLEPIDDAAEVAGDTSEPDPEADSAEEDAGSAVEPEPVAASEPEVEPEQEPETAEEALEEAPAPAPKPRGLDDTVKDILREEVEYETQARAAEQPQSLETQGDLGLDQGEDRPAETDRRTGEAAARLRRLRGEDDNATAAAVAATVRSSKDTRRDLLPDIEEINSTLRTTGDSPRNPDLGQKSANKASRARGFRLGFALVLLIAGAAVFVYSSHASLSQNYPQAAPYIDSFMSSANGARIWLDDQVTGLFLKLNALTGQS